jgi:LPS-assembly lipoprotein
MKLAVARCLALALVAVFLQGCGFRPLYGQAGTTNASPEVSTALAAITIRPIADRDGVRLRQALRERLQPTGLSERPLYALDVQMRSQVQELGIRSDATASHANLIYTARFSLTEGGTRILSDTVQSIVSYNILDDQYATVAAVGNASDRAIKQIGDEIKVRLAIFFDHRAHAQAASR